MGGLRKVCKLLISRLARILANVTINQTANVLLSKHDRRFPGLLARQPDPLRRIRRQQTPGLALIENSSHTAVHVANRLWSQTRRKRVEEILKFNGPHSCEFH